MNGEGGTLNEGVLPFILIGKSFMSAGEVFMIARGGPMSANEVFMIIYEVSMIAYTSFMSENQSSMIAG